VFNAKVIACPILMVETDVTSSGWKKIIKNIYTATFNS
jgi:hypothetical protein